MRNDWEKPIDKGPQLKEQLEEQVHYKSKKKGKKKFLIERRLIRKPYLTTKYMDKFWKEVSQWHSHKRYHTAADRDKALKILTSEHHAVYGHAKWEYRSSDK